MQENKYINICFTKSDQDLLAWANMLKENGENVSTWVQAALLSEIFEFPLDIGGIYAAPKKKSAPTPKPMSLMFGDDEDLSLTDGKSRSGRRGMNEEYVEGSIIAIRITRPAVRQVIERLALPRRRLGPYVKAIIRKRIRKLDRPPNEIPDASQLRDIFVLYDTEIQTQVEISRKKPNESCGEITGEGRTSAEKKKRRRSRDSGKALSSSSMSQKTDSEGKQEESMPRQSEKTTAPNLSGEEEGQLQQGQKRKNPLLSYIVNDPA